MEKKKTLGVSISPIDKADIIIKGTEELKYFYEPKPNTVINDINLRVPYAKDIEYCINSDSLNDRYDYKVKKPKNTFRIITLGDSFTYGLYVNTKDNWSEKLEDKLNEECKDQHFEVINLGMHGYDIRYEIERYQKRGVKYKPDLLIWLIIDESRFDEKLLPLNQKIKKDMKKSGEFEDNIKEGKYYESWIKAKTQVLEELGEENIIAYHERIINELNKGYNNRLLFLTRPNNSTDRKLDKYFERLALNNQNRFFSKEIMNLKSQMFFPNDGHPNAQGHLTIAGNIFNYLVDKRIISCD